ncbi:MAG TPA: hypothetical protein GX511_01440, partial [Firmicutes bacterium]|nr:hypothetical protein [Bacillota bacterium]
RRYPRLLTVEDHALAGGFGSAVLELLNDAGVLTSVKRLGIADRFIEQASRTQQLRANGLDEASLKETLCGYFAGRAAPPARHPQDPPQCARVVHAYGR